MNAVICALCGGAHELCPHAKAHIVELEQQVLGARELSFGMVKDNDLQQVANKELRDLLAEALEILDKYSDLDSVGVTGYADVEAPNDAMAMAMRIREEAGIT